MSNMPSQRYFLDLSHFSSDVKIRMFINFYLITFDKKKLLTNEVFLTQFWSPISIFSLKTQSKIPILDCTWHILRKKLHFSLLHYIIRLFFFASLGAGKKRYGYNYIQKFLSLAESGLDCMAFREKTGSYYKKL